MEYLSTEAKNNFGQVLSKTFEEGPQYIRRHGRRAVIMSEEHFEALKQSIGHKREIEDPLLNGPQIDQETASLFLRDRGLDRPLPELP